ncbi:MAG: S1C family serine protease [Dehalococcoidia bacterium]
MVRFGLLMALLGGAVLVGCGGGGDDAEAPSTTASASVSASASASKTPTLQEIVDANKPSIVEILVSSADGDGGGTGIVWENDKQILTNAHVVLGAATIKVVDPADKGRSYPARIVALSPCDDVALLAVERGAFKPVKIGDSGKVEAGTAVVAVGFPGTAGTSGGSGLVVTEGIASRTKARFTDSGQDDLIQHTAPINPGNSGGPLFNRAGEVVGINSYSVRGAQAENYAISINEAIFVAEKLKAGKNLNYVGLDVVTNNRTLAQEEDLPYIDGLAIMAVAPGSAATKTKPYALASGYTVGFIDGKFIENVGTYCDVLRSHKSGDTVKIRFGAYDTAGKASLFDSELVIE